MISVIVPVYNVEKYLRRCVDSILAQTYTDFEVVLVDDGSTDASGSICDSYLSDSRVKVSHKSNGGASSARNVGMLVAKGEWVVFVDADDWCDPHYLEVLCSSGEVDFTTVFMRVYSEGQTVNRVLTYDKKVFTSEEVSEFMALYYRELAAPVCRRYRKDIIFTNNLCFDENLSIMEDLVFNISYLRYVKSVRVIPDILYYYEKHQGSLTFQQVDWERANYAINRLGNLFISLPYAQKFSHYYIWGNVLRKYFTSLQQEKSLCAMSKHLKIVLENKFVHSLFVSGNSYKSKFRLCFDFFMTNKMTCCASLMLKLEGLMLRLKIIHWK